MSDNNEPTQETPQTPDGYQVPQAPPQPSLWQRVFGQGKEAVSTPEKRDNTLKIAMICLIGGAAIYCLAEAGLAVTAIIGYLFYARG